MLLTRYGIREILIATLLAAVAGALSIWLLWSLPWVMWPVVVIVAVLWCSVLAFFRDPTRNPPTEPNVLVSPADGQVADITEIDADSLLGRPGVRIGVFMSVFNVHVNRCPCDGRIEKITHRLGRFMDIRLQEAFEQNESTTIRMICTDENGEYPIVVRQIAGLVARRIVTDLCEGQDVTRGQRIGMIKFGSRLELYVPHEQAGPVRVELGQMVQAGQTVLIAVKG